MKIQIFHHAKKQKKKPNLHNKKFLYLKETKIIQDIIIIIITLL
jgi:hypothetical protein